MPKGKENRKISLLFNLRTVCSSYHVTIAFVQSIYAFRCLNGFCHSMSRNLTAWTDPNMPSGEPYTRKCQFIHKMARGNVGNAKLHWSSRRTAASMVKKRWKCHGVLCRKIHNATENLPEFIGDYWGILRCVKTNGGQGNITWTTTRDVRPNLKEPVVIDWATCPHLIQMEPWQRQCFYLWAKKSCKGAFSRHQSHWDMGLDSCVQIQWSLAVS